MGACMDIDAVTTNSSTQANAVLAAVQLSKTECDKGIPAHGVQAESQILSLEGGACMDVNAVTTNSSAQTDAVLNAVSASKTESDDEIQAYGARAKSQILSLKGGACMGMHAITTNSSAQTTAMLDALPSSKIEWDEEIQADGERAESQIISLEGSACMGMLEYMSTACVDCEADCVLNTKSYSEENMEANIQMQLEPMVKGVDEEVNWGRVSSSGSPVVKVFTPDAKKNKVNWTAWKVEVASPANTGMETEVEDSPSEVHLTQDLVAVDTNSMNSTCNEPKPLRGRLADIITERIATVHQSAVAGTKKVHGHPHATLVDIVAHKVSRVEESAQQFTKRKQAVVRVLRALQAMFETTSSDHPGNAASKKMVIADELAHQFMERRQYVIGVFEALQAMLLGVHTDEEQQR